MATMYAREDSRRLSDTPDAILEDNWAKTFGSADSATMRAAEERERSGNSLTGQYKYLKCISCGEEKEYSDEFKFEICSKCGSGTFRTKHGWR